jgi:YHS domain-containing protein
MNSIYLLLFLLSISTHASGQKPAVYSVSGKAINGYDPVAYFVENKPIKGNAAILFRYQDAVWNFASEENKQAFIANPEKYAPQYGGYCAYGLSEGYKAPTEADAWTIDNGQLYLNYNTDVRTKWNKNRGERIKKADANWTRIDQDDQDEQDEQD